MVKSISHRGGTSHPLEGRVGELRQIICESDPDVLAVKTGAIYYPLEEGSGEFRISVWGKQVTISFPDFTARVTETDEPLETFTLALLAYYFYTSDGTPLVGRWIAFTELPDGKFYTQAFQGYTGQELVRNFGNDIERFISAAESLGGRHEALGDAAFSFEVLPRVVLMVVCWLDDDDFPPSFRILFDASVSHHLSTDTCAVIGSALTKQLIQAKI